MEKGIVAGALFFTSILSPAPTPTPQTSQVSQPEMSIYRVKEGDSMQSIAQNLYGSPDYWTNIWNDNDSIKNPNLIEKDQEIRIEVKKTEKPQELNKDLSILLQVDNSTVYSLPQAQRTNSSQTQNQTVTFSPNSLTDEQINFLGNCESGMTAARNSGNGFYGAFQFTIGTWSSMGTGYERADMAPLDVQKDAVQRLVARSSIYGQFPGCSAKMRGMGLL